MIPISYPLPDFRIRKDSGKEMIFDPLRKKWIQLTPEEWVRQNFIQYLVQEKKYAASLIAIEKEMKLGELTKRFDILVYDTDHRPWMMIECKGAAIKLESPVLEQILRYNISIPVKYMIITNGNTTFGWERMSKELRLIDVIPDRQ